jgi:hypothetical protein
MSARPRILNARQRFAASRALAQIEREKTGYERERALSSHLGPACDRASARPRRL